MVGEELLNFVRQHSCAG